MQCLIYNYILIFYLGVDCGEPPLGTNTIDIPANLSLKLGDQYTYSCSPGFKLASGDLTTICLEDGTFSTTPAICTGMCYS